MSLYRYHMISIFTQTGDELSRNRPAPETRYFSSCAFSVMIDYKLYWTGQFFLLFIHLFMCFNIKYHSFLLLNIKQLVMKATFLRYYCYFYIILFMKQCFKQRWHNYLLKLVYMWLSIKR